MNISLRQLEYVVAVADEASFSRAAERCFVSQPTLSVQVREAERSLGTVLFERSRRGVRLTDSGRELTERARSILRDVDGLEAAARGRRGPLSGALRLGVIPTVAPYVLPDILPELDRSFPDLELSLVEDRTRELVKRLEDGALDVLLLALEAELGDAVARELFEDPFVLAMPAGHRLAGKRPLRESELDELTLLLLDDGHCLREQALGVCLRSGGGDDPDFRAASLATLVRLVEAGYGATLLPSMAVEAETRGRRAIVTRPLARGVGRRTIGLAWRPTTARAADFAALGDLIERRWAGRTGGS